MLQILKWKFCAVAVSLSTHDLPDVDSILMHYRPTLLTFIVTVPFNPSFVNF